MFIFCLGIFSSTHDFETSRRALEVIWTVSLVQGWDLCAWCHGSQNPTGLVWAKKLDLYTTPETVRVYLLGKKLFNGINTRFFCVFVLIRGSAVLPYPITQGCHGRWFFGPWFSHWRSVTSSLWIENRSRSKQQRKAAAPSNVSGDFVFCRRCTGERSDRGSLRAPRLLPIYRLPSS